MSKPSEVNVELADIRFGDPVSVEGRYGVYEGPVLVGRHRAKAFKVFMVDTGRYEYPTYVRPYPPKGPPGLLDRLTGAANAAAAALRKKMG